jgi:predicted nucleotidyltransferase
MDRGKAIKLLQNQIAELKMLGVRSLALFGSVARNEATQGSDVDLLIDLEPPLTFDRYIAVKFYLEDLLGHEVDLIMVDTLKPRALVVAKHDAIIVA